MMSGNAPEEPAQVAHLTADDFLQITGALAREERWEELAEIFIERAESAVDLAEKIHSLIQAAHVFEGKLHDSERAYFTLIVAFQTDPESEEAKDELARMATAGGRWEELLGELSTSAAELTTPSQQAAMYLVLADWYQEHLGDASQAERALEAVLAIEPAHPKALRTLVDIFRRRGDNARAAMCLVKAASLTSDPAGRVVYTVEAAEIFRNVLGDADSAAEQYRRVLDTAPNHVVAIQGLAEIAWEQKNHAEAFPLFEKMAVSTRGDREQIARYYHRAAWSLEMLGDVERARENYRRAFAANDGYLPTLLCWSELALSQKWSQDIVEVIPTLLARPESGLTGEEQVEHLVGLGQARLSLGEIEAASNALTSALELAPNHEEARETLAKAHSRMSGQGAATANAIVEQQRLLLGGAKTDDERLAILEEIARIRRDDLGDKEGALSTYSEMLAIHPDDSVVLHEMLEIYTSTAQWKRAVDVLEYLCQVATGEERLRYLVARGNILSYELDHHDEALAIYDQVLESNPHDERTFGRIERILVASESWRDLARHYRKHLKRIGTNPSPELRARVINLWRSLGDLCWRRLQEFESATAAFEVSAELDPSDLHSREALAEIYESMGPDKLPQAIAAHERLLDLTNDADVMAQHIRSMARLYGQQQKFDRLYCTSATLVAMARAIPQEQAFYDRTTHADLTRAAGIIDESTWRQNIASPQQNRHLSHIFAAVSGAVGTGRAKAISALGLEPSQEVDLTSDHSLVGQMLIYCSQFLSIPLPRVYVSNNYTGDLDLQLVLDGQQVVPSLILGQSLITDRGEKELAFFLGRKLARLRADHFVLWPSVVPNNSELQVILAAAVSLVHPTMEWPGVDPAAMRNYANYFRQNISGAVLAGLASAVDIVLQEQVDLEMWATATRQTEDRAGLLCSGDVACALREVLRAHVHGRDSEAMALVRFSVSTAYLDLRERLRMSLDVVSTPRSKPARSAPRKSKPKRH
jgi:tetratricopeptide (TPR) repeat protein